MLLLRRAALLNFQMQVDAPASVEVTCVRCRRPLPSDVYWCPSCGKLNASTRARIIFFVILACIFAGIAVTGRYVAYLKNVESSLANRWYTRGEQAMAAKAPQLAIDDFRNALGYDGANVQYRMRLAEALMAMGRLPEARAYLLSLWSAEPADAEVNLDLARLYVKETRPELAIRYYRMAIDGIWDGDPLQHRIDTRLELVQYLLDSNEAARAGAELVALQAEAPDNPDVQSKAGALLLRLGDNQRAEKAFELVLKLNPQDAQPWLGAGQAALANGDYRKAVRLLSTAANLSSAKAGSPEEDQLALARAAFDADPSLRTLSLTERANRVAAAFQLAMNWLEECAAKQAIPPTPAAPVAPTPSSRLHVPFLSRKPSTLAFGVLPSAPATDSLQLLYESGLQRRTTATAEALHKDPDSMAPTMEFVYQAVKAVEKTCPPQDLSRRALQLLAHHETEDLR
jgi:tetratricopeptide (TPR) repeat protein